LKVAETNFATALKSVSGVVRTVNRELMTSGGTAAIFDNNPRSELGAHAAEKLLTAGKNILSALDGSGTRREIDIEKIGLMDMLSEASVAFRSSPIALDFAVSVRKTVSQLRSSNRDDPQLIGIELRALHRVAGFSRREGLNVDAREAAKEELNLAEQVAQNDPLNPEWQWYRAFARESLADTYRWRDPKAPATDWDNAVRLYQEFLSLTDAHLGGLRAVPPRSEYDTKLASANWQQRFAIVNGKLTDIYQSLAQELDSTDPRRSELLLSAQSHADENDRVMSELVKEYPSNSSFRLGWAIAHERLGVFQIILHPDDYETSEGEFQKSQAQLQEILRDAGNRAIRRVESIDHLGIGLGRLRVAERLDDPNLMQQFANNAFAHFAAARDIACTFAEQDRQEDKIHVQQGKPGAELDRVWQNDCAIAYQKLAEASNVLQRPRDVIEGFLKWCKLYRMGGPRDTRQPVDNTSIPCEIAP
jgi:hypothetical protein